MKRFFLSSLMLLAAGRSALCFENSQIVQVPPMDPQLVVIDDTNFINHSLFQVDLTTMQSLFGGTAIFTTSSTLNYTNDGVMVGVPGFDLENFPASVGQAKMAANFANIANGPNGGEIYVTNFYGGLNPFAVSAFLNLIGGPVNVELPGLANFKVRATNILDSGLINMDSTGLIDLLGKDVNLDHSRFVMTGGGGVSALDYGGGGFGTNSSGWSPLIDLQQNLAISPIFTNFQGIAEQMFLGNPIVYFQNTDPQPGPDGVVVWRIIYLQDSSPSNVTASVFFGNAGLDAGAFHVQWSGFYRDPFTGGLATNYFAFSDVPELRRGPFFFAIPGLVPQDFSFLQGNQPLIAGAPATPSFVNTPFNLAGVTNDFSYISAQPTAVSVGTNQIVGGNPTNLPGRIQLTGQNSLNLANSHIAGGNYLLVNSPVNYLGNSNSMIQTPYADLNLGVTSGSLTLSNLLSPDLPGWTGVGGAPSAVFSASIFGAPMGGIQAFSGSYLFTSTNLVGANLVTVTNDVRVLMVNSSLQPTFQALQKDVRLHAVNNLVIADQLNVFNQFFSDTAALTIGTNSNSGYSLSGGLNFISQDILWSTSFTNLQYLTNWGGIRTTNLANFADNMLSPFSPRSGAVAYQAFVNHGTISDDGAFIFANYFENSGVLEEWPNGNIDISAVTAIDTNSLISATNGSVSITANSLLVSNSIINAGRSLTLSASCSLSDGYVFGNMFGHATNAALPNVVTNGNFFSAGGGVRVLVKPATADLLGTTITNIATNSLASVNQWAGEDRGVSPSGFADNLALGRMIFVSDSTPSQFTFMPVNGNNAIYIDTIDLEGGATNTALNGDYTAFNIQPGMKIYYAQALQNGASIAEKLNGKNGGRFLWVSNYAGVYSSTNLQYSDGNTYIFNDALVISPDIDTDGDGTVNRDDPEPIPAGLTFDFPVVGPGSCSTNVVNPPFPPDGGGSQKAPGELDFPAHQTGNPGGSGGVSFALAQGSYNGLFYETNAVNPAHAGFFTAKVTGKGSFSAKLQLGAMTYSISKAFNASGACTTQVTGKGLPTLNLTLQLVNNDQIVGQVSGNGWTAQLLAVIETAALASKSSLVLSTTNDQSSTTVSGDSFGTMSLSKNGQITWSGVLPDGGKVSQKSALSKGGIWPMYSSLYGGSGSLIGWLRVTNGNNEIGGSAVWIVPANQNALYPNGLTNKLNATGSSVANPRALSHSTIVLSGPHLTSPLTNNVTISGKTGHNDDKSLSLSVDIKNGLFNGSVVDPNSGQTLSFQGALLEKSGIGGGFFLNANKDQGGKVYLAPAN